MLVQIKLENRQRVFGILLFCVISLVLCSNMLYYHFLTAGGVDSNFYTPNIILLLSLLPIILLTCFWKSKLAGVLQCLILYSLGAVAVFANIDSFWGWGLYIVAIGLAYSYCFFDKKFILKYSLSLLSLVCIGIVGQWYSGYAFFAGVYSLVILLFFVLMGFVVILIIDNITQKIEALEITIEKQTETIQKLSEQPAYVRDLAEIKKNKQLIMKLSPKELNLLEVFCNSQGALRNKELGQILEMTEDSVKTSFSRIKKKAMHKFQSSITSFSMED